jgi:glycosyltransferase involved in cell wall biosynthesis
MRILIVNMHMEIGGIRQSLLNMIENIKDEGYAVDLQILRHDAEMLNVYSQLGWVHVCKPLMLLNTYLTPLSTLIKKKKYAHIALKTLLVFIRKFAGNKRMIDWLVKINPKTPEYDVAISFSNDIWSNEGKFFTGGCNSYTTEKVDAKKKIAWVHSDPRWLGFTHKICEATYKDFDDIVNVSYACKEMFDEIIPEFKNKSKVVYNMFDVERVKRLSNNNSPYKQNVFNIVTVARLSNQPKRIDRVIECCSMLKQAGYRNIQWHVVGDGPDKQRLIKYSEEMNIGDMVVFEGRKDNPYPYMKYADVFVLVSDYEAYGMVLTESLITGTPVISTNFPAACEVVSDGINGLLVGIETVAIYNAVKKVIDQPELLKELRENITSHSTNNVAVQQFKEVVETL